jgi:hypothetical protein
MATIYCSIYGFISFRYEINVDCTINEPHKQSIMGAVDKYNLKWNDFESGLLSGFQDIRKSQQFFDVTLVCEASQIQAHKVIYLLWSY